VSKGRTEIRRENAGLGQAMCVHTARVAGSTPARADMPGNGRSRDMSSRTVRERAVAQAAHRPIARHLLRRLPADEIIQHAEMDAHAVL
jgi:hypothetical protein